MSRHLSDWIDAFLQYTENTEPSDMYRRWCAISTVASVLQRKCKLKWGSKDFFPNMFIVLVGPPAARKGTAMEPGKELLDSLGILVSADETSRQKIVQSLKQSQAAEQNTKGTFNYHASMTIFSTELTVFIGYESKELISMLCKLYDCESRYVYDTISRGREEVPNVWLNLLGATTPAQLQASLPEGAVGSGFTSRIVFVFEENKGKMVIKPTMPRELREALEHDLGSIKALSGSFETTERFEELYKNWRIHSEESEKFAEPRMEYYTQRRPTHLFKLCMIHSASRSDEMVITEEDLGRSIEALDKVEEKMSKVFAGVGQNPLAGIQISIRKVIETRGTMPMKELARMFESDAGHTQLAEALNSLEQMGHIQLDVVNKRILWRGE